MKRTDNIFNFLSLSDSKSRFFIFLFVILFLLFIPVEFLENSHIPTPCKIILEENCPSDGITRGVSSLLKLNFNDAIKYNILSIPTIIVMISITILDFRKTFGN